MGPALRLSPAPGHWSVANPGNRATRAELLAALLAAAAPRLAAEDKLLDCGCGHGWLLEALASSGVEPGRMSAIDSDPERAAAAARRVPGTSVAVADARELPFGEAEFAVVFQLVALSSFGSAASVRAALAEARRVLAADGMLLVYEPRLPNPLNRRTRRLRRADLRAAGLRIEASRTLTLLPPLGRRLGRLTPALHRPLSALPPLRSHRLLVCRRR